MRTHKFAGGVSNPLLSRPAFPAIFGLRVFRKSGYRFCE